MIYVDTSLLLPVYVPEERSEEANRLLETVSSIVISDLTFAEFHVGLARKVKLGTLSASQSGAAQAALDSHLRDGVLQRVALQSSHYDAAGRMASKAAGMLRTLDALHVAVAAGLGSPMATFDGRLAEAARDLGFEVLP